MLVGSGLKCFQLPAQLMQRLPAALQLRQALLPGKHALQGGACATSGWLVMQRAILHPFTTPLHASAPAQAAAQPVRNWPPAASCTSLPAHHPILRRESLWCWELW